MSFVLQELAIKLGAALRGEPQAVISDVASLPRAQAGHLTYAESRKQMPLVQKTSAAAVLINEELSALLDQPLRRQVS